MPRPFWAERRVYNPTIIPSNDIKQVEEEIHDCIRIAHPGFPRASLPEFIDSVDEVVESRRSNVF